MKIISQDGTIYDEGIVFTGADRVGKNDWQITGWDISGWTVCPGRFTAAKRARAVNNALRLAELHGAFSFTVPKE